MQTDPNKAHDEKAKDVELNDEQLESASGGAPTPEGTGDDDTRTASPWGGSPR